MSFFSAATSHQEALVGEITGLFNELWPTGSWEERGSSAHYQYVFGHVTGARLELTPPTEESGRNEGGLLLTLPGGCFWLQPSASAAYMLWHLTRLDGFKHFTRLDFQSTELEPEWPAERVIHEVEAGRIWVKGHRSYRLWAEREADGAIQDGATIYWGSPRSDRQGRSYDKAAEARWPKHAIRDEVQLRRGWAKAAGKQLVTVLESNLSTDDMDSGIRDLAAGVINKHLQYWTLNGADPANDKNWTRKAEPAAWFKDRIGTSVAAITKAPRPVQDLESTVGWGVQQYGRHFALYAWRRALESGMPIEQVREGLFELMEARLKPEDIATLFPQMDRAELEQRLEELEALQARVAWEEEHRETEDGGTPVL